MRGFFRPKSHIMATILLLAGTSIGSAENRVTAIDPQLLPDPDLVQAWHEHKAEGIHTFTGSPSWQDFMTVVEGGMEAAGVTDIIRDTFSYKRWYTSDDPGANKWSLSIAGENIPVASYWAYSGSTGEDGVTAPLVVYDKKHPPESMAGKIVVFQIPALEEPLPSLFQPAGYEFATDKDTLHSNDILAANQWYQTNYVTRFGRFNAIVKNSGAAGALVIFNMGPERTAGLYTFPMLEPGITGVPGLYIDKVAGEQVLQAAATGAEATLRLLAQREEVEGHFFTGFLPGRNYGKDNDEYVFLITHADGPNLTQDNGGFALLSIVQYFSNIPEAERPRTLAIMLDSQHFTPHRHMDDWYAMHPEIVERIVATIGVEHLGQREYVERDGHFVQSGLPETTFVFAQDNDRLIGAAIEGVKAFSVPRTMVQSPPRGGQGNWSGMSDVSVKKNYPGYGISTNMSAYWSTRAGIDTFDKNLFIKQVGLAAHLTGTLMTLTVDELAIPKKE
ncbi:MAG: hypothetical protein ACR2P6_04210 [Gammaproteobacteria bacterium]